MLALCRREGESIRIGGRRLTVRLVARRPSGPFEMGLVVLECSGRRVALEPGERAELGEGIAVMVGEILTGRRARIAVEAPADVKIWREELVGM